MNSKPGESENRATNLSTMTADETARIEEKYNALPEDERNHIAWDVQNEIFENWEPIFQFFGKEKVFHEFGEVLGLIRSISYKDWA